MCNIDTLYYKIIADCGFAFLAAEMIILCLVYPGIDHRLTHYRLRVSPDFTTEQQETIRQAADQWEQAVEQGKPVSPIERRRHYNPRMLTISITVGACPSKPDEVEACLLPVPHIIDCLEASHNAAGCTQPIRNYAKVQIDTQHGTIRTFSLIVKHELGHVCGLNDSDIKGAVMYGLIEPSDQQSSGSQDVSSMDVDAYLHPPAR